MTTYDVAIIGGGPAGASAAIFTARAKLTTLLVDADAGLTRRALVHNHLGLPDGISGPDLVERGHAHAQKAGATFVKAKLKSLEKTGAGFTLVAEDGTKHEAKQVIIATGVNLEVAKAAGVPSKPGTEPYIKEVLVVQPDGKTNVAGLWAAGVAAGVSVHTIVTAGDGARVACNIISELKGARWADHDSLK
jgi:thioredoxin reductase (NADPH)